MIKIENILFNLDQILIFLMWPINWWTIERMANIVKNIILNFVVGKEALESVMCDVIKIRLKRRDATRSKKK